jgi:hypothetical protein
VALGHSFGGNSGIADMITGRLPERVGCWLAGLETAVNASAFAFDRMRPIPDEPDGLPNEPRRGANEPTGGGTQTKPVCASERTRRWSSGPAVGEAARSRFKESKRTRRTPAESERTRGRHCVASVAAAPPRMVALARLAMRSARGLEEPAAVEGAHDIAEVDQGEDHDHGKGELESGDEPGSAKIDPGRRQRRRGEKERSSRCLAAPALRTGPVR